MNRTLEILSNGITQGLHTCAQIYVWRDGNQIINTAIGSDTNGNPITIEHRLLWMSGGKPLAAIAVMQLVEKNLLSLDTRVSQIIPEFAAGNKDPITLKQLLTHTAGFRGPLNSFTPGPIEEILKRIFALRLEPNWVPGEKAGYHVASSWFVLGEIIRRLDGRSFNRYVREEIFGRLGLNGAFVGMKELDVSQLDVLVTPDFPGNQVVDAWTIPRPPANARGPIDHLGKIYVSLLSGDGKLLRPETVKLMIHRHRDGMFDETFKQTIDWGLGFKLDSKCFNQTDQYGYGSHASDQTFGHSGNQCSCAFGDPKYQLAVAWCVNGMPGEARHQVRQNQINTAIYEDLSLANSK